MQQSNYSSLNRPPDQLSQSIHQLIKIARCDRWQAHQRLEELGIFSSCLADGSFQVEVYSPLTVVQLQSVLCQLTAPRQQLIDRLEQCWQHS